MVPRKLSYDLPYGAPTSFLPMREFDFWPRCCYCSTKTSWASLLTYDMVYSVKICAKWPPLRIDEFAPFSWTLEREACARDWYAFRLETSVAGTTYCCCCSTL